MCFPAINPAFSFALSYSWAPTTFLSSPYPSCINTIKVRWNYGYNEPANHRGVDTCTKFNVHCPGSPLTWVVCPSDIANNFSTTLDICDVRLWNPWGISNISVTVETLVRKDQSPCQKKELHNSTRHNPTHKHKHTHTSMNGLHSESWSNGKMPRCGGRVNCFEVLKFIDDMAATMFKLCFV